MSRYKAVINMLAFMVGFFGVMIMAFWVGGAYAEEKKPTMLDLVMHTTKECAEYTMMVEQRHNLAPDYGQAFFFHCLSDTFNDVSEGIIEKIEEEKAEKIGEFAL